MVLGVVEGVELGGVVGFVVGLGLVVGLVVGFVGVVVGFVGLVDGFVVGLVVGLPLFMVPLFIVPVESRIPFRMPVESRIPFRMPRRIPFRPRMPRRPRIVLSLDIVPLMELLMLELFMLELVPDEPMSELPERASAMLGRVSPGPKPMCIASISACVSPVTLYFCLHVAMARRVVASMRPVTCFTPQPSSRSCCCRASSSTWLMPLLPERLSARSSALSRALELRCDMRLLDM